MSTVTVPQVNPNDEVTALSVNQGPNAIAAVLNGNIDDTNVSTLSGTKITAGTVPIAAFDVSSNPETREFETIGDMVVSGLIWSQTTGLVGTMTAGTAYINGKRLTPTAVATNSFTASKDTYIYLDNTGTVQYNPQTTGAAEPSIPSNYITLAKVITGASAITSVVDLRPTSKAMRYAQITSTFTTTSTTSVQVTGLTATINVPTGGRRVKITAFTHGVYANAGTYMALSIWDGTVGTGTQLQSASFNQTGTSAQTTSLSSMAVTTPAAGSKTYNIGFSTSSGTGNIEASATTPTFMIVEYV